MTAPVVAVGVASYRRPELLRDLIDSLQAATLPPGTRVVVVDNDPARSAEPVVAARIGLDVRYRHEPRPGIAEARNAFLDEAVDADLLAFVDDDERVDPGWLTALLRTAAETGADVVGGPVLPVFPADAPRWAVDGGFFERARHPTGTRLELAATNNALVRRVALDALAEPRFDPAYSVTGGSDSDLFSRLRANGATIVWCDDAIVHEIVPDERLTWSWVRRRAVRTGEVRARLLLRESRKARVLVEAGGRLLVGAGRSAVRALSLRPPNAWSLNPLCRGWGMLRVFAGRLTAEYARDDSGPAATQ